jgi:hypothetical protein
MSMTIYQAGQQGQPGAVNPYSIASDTRACRFDGENLAAIDDDVDMIAGGSADAIDQAAILEDRLHVFS